MVDALMDGFHVRAGDVLQGQWTLAEFSSPVALGAVFIRNFTLKRVTADSKGRPQFYLVAEDLFYSSIENWTVPIWEFKKVGNIRREDAESYAKSMVDKLKAYTMVEWDRGYPVGMKRNIAMIAARAEFNLSKKDLIEFMSRREMKHSAHLEKMKIEGLLNLPESAFKGGDAKGLRWQIQKRWRMRG
jgi:hypothetical protein